MLNTDKRRPRRLSIGGASAIALATALAAGPAQAQVSLSYNAPDPTVASGSVTFQRGVTPGLEVYNVQSPTAVLDFTPSDTTGTGTINFQNSGTSVFYQGTSDFTVLNRIVPVDPSRAVQFNGTVRSLVSSSPGGSVWFYSPGGIVLGGSAVFDVGSLLLATGDPTGGTGSIGSTSSFSINSASNPNAAVTIQPGAQITASPQSSYVALVAPIVNQNGNVRVNGSAAYVAAENATLSINQGLFDIAVTVGSDGAAGVPLTHNGTTGGPASTGFGDNHGIFMVAVPKNSAITMMIAPSGQLGFDVASSASIENGAIYLQAGGDLSVNPLEPVETRIQDLPTSPLDASIKLSPGTVSSALVAQSTNSTYMTTNGSTPLVLQGQTYLYGGKEAQIGALSGGSFTAEDRVVVNSFGAGPGQAIVFAQAGATMDFQGALDIFASSYPLRTFPGSFDVSKGGSARLHAIGGTITATQVRINSAGIGSSSGGDTFGGDSRLIATAGGSVVLSGSVEVNASASAFGTSTGTGGDAQLAIDDGSIDIAGDVDADATAVASDGASAVGGLTQIFAGIGGGSLDLTGSTSLRADAIGFSVSLTTAGSATGGTAAVDLLAPTGILPTSINVGHFSATATAVGSSSSSGIGAGGAATGGSARIATNVGTSFTATETVALIAASSGGDGALGANGGNATAGAAQLTTTGGIIALQDLSLNAATISGSGGTGFSSAPGGAGGNAIAGGGATIFADASGTITATSTAIDTSARGGDGGDGLSGTGVAGSGGSAASSTVGISTGGPGQIKLGSVDLLATASSGSTGSGLAQSGTSGGAAQAGNVFVVAATGTIEVASFQARDDANGGFGFADGSNGGDAVAGDLSIGSSNGGALKILGGSLFLSAEGFGGGVSAISGNSTGGAGTGGVATIFSNGGVVDSFATYVSLDASGDGGSVSGSGTGSGGLGQGGHARIATNGGTITLRSDVDMVADGSGGFASGNGNGGNGIGGEARLGTFGAASASKVVVLGDLVLDASGSGGFADGGKGGDGLGGTPPDLDLGPFDKGAYIVGIGGTVSVSGTVDMDAAGFGGSGDAGGGAGIGGFTNISSYGAAIDALGFVTLDSSGRGGDGLNGSAGGLGTGGASVVSATSGGDSKGGGVIPLGTPASIVLGTFFQDASGQGGDGGTGLPDGAGGAGGDGVGGFATLLALAGSGTLKTDNVFIFVQGAGGDGGDGGGASSATIGGSGGKGGAGTGGFTNFGTASGQDTTVNNGSATFADITGFADGIGGSGGFGTDGSNGGDGGAAFGGNGALLSRGAPVTAGTISIDSSAFGGQGGDGAVEGAGGAAQGGSANMLITNRFNRTERGSLIATDFGATAGAFGGLGSTTGASKAGQVLAQVTQSDVTLDSLSLSSFSIDPLATGAESTLLVDAGTLTVNSALSASTVGDLRFGAVNGGILKASSIFLDATGALLPPTSGTPGVIDIASDFFASFGGDFATTSDFDVDGSFSVDAGGQLQVGNVTSGGSVSLSSAGALTAGNIAADDSIFIFGQGDVTTGDLTAALGNQSLVFGDIEVGGGGAISLGNVTGATIDVYTDVFSALPSGNIVTGNLTAETISVDGAASVTTGNLKSGDFYSGIDTSGDNYLIAVAAVGDTLVGNVDALTSVGLASQNGSVTAGAITVGDSALLLASTNIKTAGITGPTGAGNNVFLSNISVLDTDPVFSGFETLDDFAFFDPATLTNATPVRLTGQVAIGGPVATGGFAAAAAGGIGAQAINAPNRLFLDSGAALTLGVVSTNQGLTLVSDSAITLGDITASTVDLKSASNISAGAITATSAVTVDSGATPSFSGQVSAPQITVTSRDLQLGANGRLGTAATTQLTLNAPGVTSFTFGGTGASGYSIDSVEAQGLRAQRIDITTSAPVTIGAVTLNGSAASSANLVGSSGQLTIDSASGIRVDGALTIANAAAGNRLRLRSTGRITVATDSGGAIAMTGASSGTLGGTLELIGDSIAVATSNLLGQLASNPNFPGRNQALATPPSGPARPEGNLQANRIELDAVSLIAIQNSGSTTQAAGFSAGAGGMQVRSRASATTPLDLFAFGRVADSSGVFKMNQDTLGAITFGTGEGVTPLSAASAVNNCVVGASACESAPVAPPMQEVIVARIPAAIQDVVEGALSSTSDPENVAALPVVRLVTTVDTAPLRTDPLIADPVSGGGNPSLWEGAEDQDDRRDDGDKPAAGQGGDQ